MRKNKFSIRKNKIFEPIGNSMHITEYLALEKALLARLCLEVKMYINLLSVHNLLCL